MIKTIMPGDYDWNDQQAVLFDVGSRGLDRDQMQKRASANVFGNVDIKPKPGRSVIHLIALGDAERYGCFFAGAPVQTEFGQLAIERVKVGDKVLTHKNRYRAVSAVFESEYTGVRASIKCLGLPDPVTATENHPFLVVRGSEFTPGNRFCWRRDGTYSENVDRLVEAAEWASASSVKPGDYMVIPVAASSELETPASSDPYAMGLYVAEGCLVKEYKDIATRGTYGKLLYTLSAKDEASIKYLQAWYEKQGREPVSPQESYTSEQGVRLAYGMRELAAYADVAFGHLAATKRIHPHVFGWSRQDRLRFLAGYFDGDGCVDATETKYAGVLKASTVSRTLAFDLQRLCASVGVSASVSRCHNYERHRTGDGFGKGTGDLVIYAISVGSKRSNVILEHCLRLRPHSHVSKYGGSSLQPSEKYALVPVETVTFDAVEAAVRYNLEVEEDNSYLVDVIGHNSNRNGDFFYGAPREIEFPEPRSLKSIKLATGNIERAWTFTKYARVYRDHKNKKTDKSYGDVLFAAHNRPMARTELLIDVPNDDPVWRDDIEKVANGEDIFFSISCKIPGDHCFPADTMITTSRGPVPIQEVGPGDEVMTRSSGYRPVSACIAHRHTGELVGIVPQGLPEVVSTADHPYFIIRGAEVRGCHGSANGSKRRHTPDGAGCCVTCGAELNYTVETAEAASVHVGDYVICPTAPGGITVSAEFAYALGVYAGDGHVISQRTGKNKRGPHRDMGVGFSVGDADPHLERLKRALGFCKNEAKYSRESGEKKAGRLRVSDQQFAAAASSLIGRGSRSKTVSGLFSTREASLAFLAGCIDSDGHVDRKSGNVRIATVSEALARGISDVCTAVGVVSSIWHQDDVDTTYGHVARMWWVFIPASCARDIVASDKVRLRGAARRNGCASFMWRGYICREVRAVRVADVEDTPVYNLDVAGDDETYVAGGVAVHNCSICGNFSKSRKVKDGGTDCRHIKHHMSELTKSGHRVGMINDHMVFFDISRVRVPADRIAFSLAKVAGFGGPVEEDERDLHRFNVPHIDQADDPFGVYASKLSEVLHKLSNIEKQIEAVGRAPNESLSFDPAVMRHLSDDERRTLGQNRGDIGHVLAALADKKICLSLSDFVKLILGDRAGGYEHSMQLASDSLPGVFSRLAEDDDDDGDLPESAMDGNPTVSSRVSEMIEALENTMSLDEEPVARRVTVVAIRKLPPPELKKAASLYDETADKMLRAYAAYKVAWCLRNGIDSRVTKLAVLQHYVGSN